MGTLHGTTAADQVSRVVECAVLAQQSTDTASTSFISTVDALSGKELSNVALPIAVKQALPLTLHDEQRRIVRCLLVCKSTLIFGVYCNANDSAAYYNGH